jgi:hypothetical protein
MLYVPQNQKDNILLLQKTIVKIISKMVNKISYMIRGKKWILFYLHFGNINLNLVKTVLNKVKIKKI